MLEDPFDNPGMTAAEARDHVLELQRERALAEETGVATIEAYIRDLDWELDAWRHVYVTQAVTEIALLRAELDGRLGED